MFQSKTEYYNIEAAVRKARSSPFKRRTHKQKHKKLTRDISVSTSVLLMLMHS